MHEKCGTKELFRAYLFGPYYRVMRYQDYLELVRGVK